MNSKVLGFGAGMILALSVLFVSVLAIPASAQQDPHSVYGVVTLDGVNVSADLTLYHPDSATELTTASGADGTYIFELSNFEYSIGDTIFINATYTHDGTTYNKSIETTISDSYTQRVDIEFLEEEEAAAGIGTLLLVLLIIGIIVAVVLVYAFNKGKEQREYEEDEYYDEDDYMPGM